MSVHVTRAPQARADLHDKAGRACPLAAGVLTAVVLSVPFWYAVIAWLT
jgi:hypothetical protein